MNRFPPLTHAPTHPLSTRSPFPKSSGYLHCFFDIIDLMEEKEIGDYRIVRLLGKGGMGAVYEVENKDGERLALKSFTSSGAHADFLRKRFVAEGKILSLLDSPYLVKVHETGFDRKTGVPYFTMDLVLGNDGEPCTLENLRTQGGLDEWKIAALYENLCCALAYLHSKGIVRYREIPCLS